MPVLIAAVIVLFALVLVDLSLSAAIIRKLRVLEARSAGSPPGGLAPGTAPGEFTALSVQGAPVTSGDLRGEQTLIGFFSSDCSGCLPKAPVFAEVAAEARRQGVRTVAVIAVMERGPEELVAALGEGPTVVTEQGRGSMGRAFEIGAFPWFMLVGPDGTVAAGGGDPADCLKAAARV
ncbi:TlpA family protein [Actinomadura viridis]|uniref:Thiol-disulfide isomerase/thioredoxin n=1 Tax=Actinomadura viridis TaxID=58110 RepID=A0A931DGU6_9ACTN|nr:TlpA disulfide reductase family protein [Actinomadura viridis]MBG6087251.1 thiol-disulfide isomerase/thioredoxin [Actinomadura viridis]